MVGIWCLFRISDEVVGQTSEMLTVAGLHTSDGEISLAFVLQGSQRGYREHSTS